MTDAAGENDLKDAYVSGILAATSKYFEERNKLIVEWVAGIGASKSETDLLRSVLRYSSELPFKAFDLVVGWTSDRLPRIEQARVEGGQAYFQQVVIEIFDAVAQWFATEGAALLGSKTASYFLEALEPCRGASWARVQVRSAMMRWPPRGRGRLRKIFSPTRSFRYWIEIIRGGTRKPSLPPDRNRP